MKFSYNWLQDYFEEKLPKPQDLADLIIEHSFEVEGVEEIDLSNGVKDFLLDIDVLPNRSHDCLSYLGMAKEVAVLTGLKVKYPEIKLSVKDGLKNKNFFDLEVEDSKLVPRATKRLVMGVKIGESPKWLVERLESMGQRSINNIVDITNFVMFETGQPVHAFDFDKLSGKDKKKILIRQAREGEKVATLDGKEFELDESVTIISDGDNPLDIAGIKGGLASGIDENTKNVVLSVCNFKGANIRKTSRKLGIRTDASARFENVITPHLVEDGMMRLSSLVSEIVGGDLAEDFEDIFPKIPGAYKIGFSGSDVNRVLGTNLSDLEIEGILDRLGFPYRKINPKMEIKELAESFVGAPYKSGASITYEAPGLFDCASFSAYIFANLGYSIPRISVDQFVFVDKINKEDLSVGDFVFANTGLVIKTGIHKESVDFLKGTKVESGVDHLGIYLGEGKIIHTSSQTAGVVVENLSDASMFKNIVGYGRVIKDEDRYVVDIPTQRLDLRSGEEFLQGGIKEDLIEEIGRIYGFNNIESKPMESAFKTPNINKRYKYSYIIKQIMADNGFNEVYGYSLTDKGQIKLANPFNKKKGYVRDNLISGLYDVALENTKYFDSVEVFEIGTVFLDGDTKPKEELRFAGVLTAKKIKEKQKPDYFFRLKGALENVFDVLKIDVEFKDGQEHLADLYLDDVRIGFLDFDRFEMFLDFIFDKVGDNISYRTISKYPKIDRDISLFVPEDVKLKEVEKIIKENAGDLLISIEVFDIFHKEDEKQKSLTFRLVFQSDEKTLSDEEISIYTDKIYSALEDKGFQTR